jgi:hypothetical protein
MKRVLSFLLMIVFLQMQVTTVFAKHGGPDFGGSGGGIDTVGTYAGTLVPVTSTTNSSNTSFSNSIGLFSLGVPDIGVADGACVVFIDGSAYDGTITGVVDPISGKLNGIVDTASTFVLVDPANPTINYRVFASGNIEATIRETASFSATSTAVTISFATTRVKGTAALDVSSSVDANGAAIVTNSVSYIVDGFKQSSNVAASTSLTGGTGVNTTP